MIRKNSGITMTTLVVTILVMVIVAGISISLGKEILNQSTDYKKETEVSILQNAVFQQYMLLKSEGNDGKIATESPERISASADSFRPSELVGTRIGKLSVLASFGFDNYKADYADTSEMAYEEFYYYLYDSDLTLLGIDKDDSDESTNRGYIVNYSTGEVFDVINKQYYVSKEKIYLEGTTSKIEETEYNNFTDE